MKKRMLRALLLSAATLMLALGSIGCSTTTGSGSEDASGGPGDTGGGEVSGDDGGTVEDGTSGDTGSSTPADVGPGVCTELNPTECALDSGCLVISGAPSAEICAESYDNWMTVPAGCMDGEGGCGAAESCAEDPATGERLTFPSTCIPSGWTSLTNEECCEDPIEPVACAELAVDACAAEAACAVISGVSTESMCADEAGTPESVGCMDAETGCDDALTCGQDPATDALLVFPDSCLPDGWFARPWETCCPVIEPPLECAEMNEADCDAAAECVSLYGGEPASWCPDGASPATTWAGCMSSDAGCAGVISCASSVATGTTLVFPGCVPAGWTSVDFDECCSTTEPAECSELNATTCGATDGCSVIAGAPFEDWCVEDFSSWMSVPAGCMDSDVGCGEAETCGEDPTTGTRLVFPSTCLPTGWQAVDYNACCSDVPDAWLHCAVPTDCQIVELACCDSCNGGWAMSVNKEYTDEVTDAFGAKECGDVFCTQLACGPLQTTCEAGLCGYNTGTIPSACESLDEGACHQDPACVPIYGDYPWCGSSPGIPDVAIFYGGCMDANTGCGDFPTCGQDPSTGQLIQFWDTCIPSDWTPVESCCPDPPPACEEGTEAPIAQMCVRGEMTATGEQLTVGGTASIQLTPEGCFSSSCTIIHEASCDVTMGLMSLSVDGTFCLGATEDQVCTADCSGGGWASCESASLVEGTWTAALDNMVLSFEGPSELPFGGVCIGSPF